MVSIEEKDARHPREDNMVEVRREGVEMWFDEVGDGMLEANLARVDGDGIVTNPLVPRSFAEALIQEGYTDIVDGLGKKIAYVCIETKDEEVTRPIEEQI